MDNKGKKGFFTFNKQAFVGKTKGKLTDFYKIKKELGKGTYGRVYQVEHKISNEIRACKHLSKAALKNTEKLNTEINILVKTDHPNIIKLYEVYEDPRYIFLIMEECTGGELFDRIIQKVKTKQLYTEKEAANIFKQLISAIAYCHTNNICHRDLKPENILYASKGETSLIKIIDFGLSAFLPGGKMKTRVGTAYYIAPEVIDKKYNEKCDLWSLGVIMYVLLKGKFPFSGSDKDQIFANIKKGVFDITSPPFDRVSKEAIELIKKLLIVNPNKRISAEEALNSPWFVNLKIKEKLSELPVQTMKELLNNVYNYHPDKVLQQAALAYLVHNNPQMKEVHNACSLYIKIDKNNDGLIKQAEFFDGLQSLFEEQGHYVDSELLEDLFRIIDADASGDIEYEEFVRAAIDKTKFLDDKILQFAFDYFDKDKSGKITLEEVKEVFQKNKEFPEQDFQMIIDQVDNNCDGMIDFKEFKEMMSTILN